MRSNIGVTAETFFTHKTGAKFVADVLPGIDDRNAVTLGCQGEGGVIAGRTGAHHYHILQIERTSKLTPGLGMFATRRLYSQATRWDIQSRGPVQQLL